MAEVKKAAKKKAPKKRRVSKKSKQTPEKPRDTCFVMMPFEEPYETYFQKIYRPAILKAGLNPMRASDLFRPSVIVSDIWDMIQQAKICLADLTTRNANVFYELGLAHSIGKPVVLVSETMDDVPFDLRSLRVKNYNKDNPIWGDALESDLVSALIEVLGDPGESVPLVFKTIVPNQGPIESVTMAKIDNIEARLRSLASHRQS